MSKVNKFGNSRRQSPLGGATVKHVTVLNTVEAENYLAIDGTGSIFDARDARLGNLASPTNDSDAVTLGYLKKKLISRDVDGNLSLEGKKIIGTALPTDPDDAANKRYVDWVMLDRAVPPASTRTYAFYFPGDGNGSPEWLAAGFHGEPQQFFHTIVRPGKITEAILVSAGEDDAFRVTVTAEGDPQKRVLGKGEGGKLVVRPFTPPIVVRAGQKIGVSTNTPRVMPAGPHFLELLCVAD